MTYQLEQFGKEHTIQTGFLLHMVQHIFTVSKCTILQGFPATSELTHTVVDSAESEEDASSNG